jgi:hypothetical protein
MPATRRKPLRLSFMMRSPMVEPLPAGGGHHGEEQRCCGREQEREDHGSPPFDAALDGIATPARFPSRTASRNTGQQDQPAPWHGLGAPMRSVGTSFFTRAAWQNDIAISAR